jgi:quinol monooxygenase YgiN
VDLLEAGVDARELFGELQRAHALREWFDVVLAVGAWSLFVGGLLMWGHVPDQVEVFGERRINLNRTSSRAASGWVLVGQRHSPAHPADFVAMPHVLIVHEVADYPVWKAVFDDAAELRHAAGERRYQVLRDETDDNLVVHFSEWTTLADARAFFESPRLVEIREQAGVRAPEFHYLVELEAGRLGSSGAATVGHPDGLTARLRTLDVFAGELPRFAADEAPSDPADLFVEWLEEAIAHGVPEPHAMTLSTVEVTAGPMRGC